MFPDLAILFLKTDSERIEYIRATLPQVPLFNGIKPNALEISAIKGGRSNFTYKVLINNNSHVVRLSGNNTEAIVAIEAEGDCVELASRLGLCPEVLYFDRQTRMQVSKYLENAQPMNNAAFNDLNNIKMAVTLFKKLHQADSNGMRDARNIFSINRNYIALIEQAKHSLPEVYHKPKAQVAAIEAIMSEMSITKVPCHNDTQPPNFLMSNNRMWLIDFERAGLNDPVFDLAKLSTESEFSPQQDECIFNNYYAEHSPTEAEMQRFQLYKPVLRFNVALWCRMKLVTEQHLTAEQIEDFTKYEKKFIVSR